MFLPIRESVSRIFSVPLVLLITVYMAFCSQFWWIPPVWDGANYYLDLITALEYPIDLATFPVGGHIGQAFYFLMALPISFIGRDYVLFNIWLTIFASAGLVGFYHLVGLVTHYAIGKWEQALYTALFAFNPTMIANLMRLNLDAGLTLFLLFYWLALWRERRILATICAFIAIFSKEISYLLVPLPFLFCFCLQPKGGRFQWLKRHVIVVVLPYLLLAAFLVYKVAIRGQMAFWGHDLQTAFMSLKPLLVFQGMIVNYAAMITMNFHWLFLLLWSILLLLIAVRTIWQRQHMSTLFLSLLLVVFFLMTVFTVTRVMPYMNLRYVMVTSPVILLGFFSVLPRGIPIPAVRGVLCAALLALLAVGSVRTIDPLPRKYFGTFSAGDHEMIAFYNAGWYIYGRDELVYNLQYMQLSKTSVEIIKDIRPTKDTVISSYSQMQWLQWTPFDPNTFEPTFEHTGINANYISVEQLLEMPKPPEKIYVVALANGRDADLYGKLYNRLDSLYANKTSKVYDVDGYRSIVYHYENPFL